MPTKTIGNTDAKHAASENRVGAGNEICVVTFPD
jgi:hypothetical protein